MNTHKPCPFCTLQTEPSQRQLRFENSVGFVIRDGYPITHGHTLIIPKHHVGSFFEITSEERQALFELVDPANPGGSRNGKIVLVQHRDIEDPDHGGTYTVKTYHSEKIEEIGVLVNQRIVLKPETNAYGYSPIVIEDVGEELVVVGEFLVVL